MHFEIIPIHETPEINGKRIGAMRRRELHELCKGLDIEVEPGAPADDMVRKLMGWHAAQEKEAQRQQGIKESKEAIDPKSQNTRSNCNDR